MITPPSIARLKTMSPQKRRIDKIRRIAKRLHKQTPRSHEELRRALWDELCKEGIQFDNETLADAVDRAIHPDYYTRPRQGYGFS
jgi:hypothetical protein